MSTEEQRQRVALLQGTLDLLILRTLLLGPTHGHAIAKAIEFNSNEVQVARGIPVSRAAPAHQAEVDCGRGGHLGEQPPGQVLPADNQGPATLAAQIDPGKPWQNGADESFNGKLRDEYLTRQWFRNRMDAKVGIEEWRRHYNEVRPHSSLGYLTPAAFKVTGGARIAVGRSAATPPRAHQEERTTEGQDLLTEPGGILQ